MYMKKKLVLVVSIIAVFGLSIVIGQSVIQSNQRTRLNPEQKAEIQTKKMIELFDLNDAQQNTVYALNLDYQNKLYALNVDKKKGVDTKASKDALDITYDEKLVAILTGTQVDKWKEYKKFKEEHPKTIKK